MLRLFGEEMLHMSDITNGTVLMGALLRVRQDVKACMLRRSQGGQEAAMLTKGCWWSLQDVATG